MKKLFVVSLVLVLALGSVFAQGASESSKKLTVGICQLVQHPALDAATQGFKDALIEVDSLALREALVEVDSLTLSDALVETDSLAL